MKTFLLKRKEVFFQIFAVAVLAILLSLFIFSPVLAYDASTYASPEAAAVGAINVDAKSTTAATKKSGAQRALDQIKSWSMQKALEELKKSGDIAWRQALKFFLNTLAYDMATYIATGDKGQLPMFQTQGWGGYLQNVADNTAGTFIESLGKNVSTVKFNLCNPDFRVMLKINLGLVQAYRPTKPACTFTEMTKNWETAIRGKDFLPKFQDMFNPWSNDLGVALTLRSGIETEISNTVSSAIKEREESGGFKSVTDVISGAIKTPGNLVRKAAEVPLDNATASEKLYTGSILADSMDIFVNTLAGKLITNWMKKGLVTSFPTVANKLTSLTNPSAQNQPEGAAGAKDRLISIVEPNFKVRADYDILADLATCPDPNRAGSNDCVINDKFRQAIEKKMTVRQALDQGYLNGNGVFGFNSDGLEPNFNEGYPYRSMIILRKYRIIPVGWEVAAQMIKDRQSDVKGTKNLKDLVDCFLSSSWCAGLVDPDWVLKAPQNFCKREGAGPEIISEQVLGEGAGSSLSVLRDDGYCADEQSCIKEKNDGSCELYGYCSAERRTWDFNANGCEPRSNTCQTFGTPAGRPVSYLENTLDFSDCDLGNAGCKKYAEAAKGSFDATAKTINWKYNANPALYLNKQAETCDSGSEGCHGFIRIKPDTAKSETYETIVAAGTDAAYERFKFSGLIHEKLLPAYLADACYTDRGTYYEPKSGAPAECANFARTCKQDEAGCELYTSDLNETKIPAKVAAEDYCPAECVGYNSFVQSQTIFDSAREAYYIPKTAKVCSAEAVGCDQFTNLDEAAKGGEGIEYYTYLRQCVKPNAGEACGEFYSWEGSDESGYQLKVESLKTAGADLNEAPVLTEDDGSLCNETIYNLPSSDPAYQADCRQFYNRAGGVSYHLYNRTIACSDNCHPYRRTGVNIDESIISSASCAAAKGEWDDDSDQCIVCKSGGKWDGDSNSCIYSAVPGLGLTCAAAQNGCREYNGNTGNNVRKIFTDDFSAGLGAWTGVDATTVSPSSEALILDANNKGSSLEVGSPSYRVKRQLGGAVTEGNSYVLSFLAKADSGSLNLNISLATSTENGLKAAFAEVKNVGTGWQIYNTNLTGLNHKVTADEILLIESSGVFYLDSVTLTEITDRYYLIKGSWKTPASCDRDTDGNPSPLYMLGCDQYRNRENKINNLRKFTKLCFETAVGCELMIDTHNSTATTSDDFNKFGTAKNIPADSWTYAVYDPEKLCGAEDKGCERLGQAYKYESSTLYGEVYLKNNPDTYKSILCGVNAVGCEAFAYNNGAKDSGEKYFKDPGDMVCEWRQESGKGDSQGWFKKKVKRCGGNGGLVCLSDSDCSGGAKCQLETSDVSCSTSTDKTLGLGGSGGGVAQPNAGWAGTCPDADSGCTEYIDPASKFNNNLIFNGSFANLDNRPLTIDGWDNLAQRVILQPNTVYRLGRADVNAGKLELSGCPSGVYEIIADNSLKLFTPQMGPLTVYEVPIINSKIFYFKGSAAGSCLITVTSANGPVELKKAAIAYELRENLDKQACNGVVNPGQGCVLFNERKQEGKNLAALTWDADMTNIAGFVNDPDKDSNVILKVAPDRVCDKWLACKSYIKDAKDNNVCFDIGLCDAVDGNGNCQSFISSPKKNQTVETLTTAGIANLSGYSKVGISGGSIVNDFYPLGGMVQAGEMANLSNGSFEYFGSNLYPIGWIWGGQTAAANAGKSWDANIFSAINNPVSAQAEGIGYAPDGASFLKLGSSYDATSEQIDVIPGTDYIITANINTKNLRNGTAKVDILNKDNDPITNLVGGRPVVKGVGIISQDLGNGWNFQIGTFNTGDNPIIKVKLYSTVISGKPEGNFYFDDIKIRPALNSKDTWHTPQSCRLYPQSDSLSCDYYEASGIRQKGWYGYCLEYDRRPGDPNTCLLWYPIDKVKGDGIEEGAGYADKTPLYYCAQGQAERVYEYRHAYFKTSGDINGCGSVVCPTGYNMVETYCHENEGGEDYASCICAPDGKANIAFDGEKSNFTDVGTSGCQGTRGEKEVKYPISDKDGWYSYDGGLINMPAPANVAVISSKNVYASFLCDSAAGQGAKADCSVIPQNIRPADCACVLTKELFRSKMYCVKAVQTVAPTGQNKFWASRVYKGSDYEAPILGYKYETDDAPFGSMVPPALSYNPYDWDGLAAKDGIQPISYSSAADKARSGKGYSWSAANAGDTDYIVNDSAQDNFPYAYEKGANPVNTTGVELIKRLFAQSYGVWQWEGTSDSGAYKSKADQDWGPPAVICPGSARPDYPNDYCAIRPTIGNIKVNGSTGGDVILTNSQFVKLTFNTKADSQQLPLVMYGVDWGDDSETIVTGVQMRDKTNEAQPEVIYHLYSYWDLKAKDNSGSDSINCSISGECRVSPKVQIKDNWGWCNGGSAINDCDQWQVFAREIIVKEK